MNNRDDFFLNKKKKVKVLKLAFRILSELRSAADMFIMTPLRDLQVFLPKIFGDFFAGLSRNPILNPITAAFSILGAIPYIFKLLFKNEVNNLGKVLDHLKRDFNIEIDPTDETQKKELEETFNKKLAARGCYHLRAEVIEKKGLFFFSKKKTHLKFKYHDVIPDFFEQNWENTKDLPLCDFTREILFFGEKDDNPSTNTILNSFNPIPEQHINLDINVLNINIDKDIISLRAIFDLQKENINDNIILDLLNIFKRKAEENKLDEFMKEIHRCQLFKEWQLQNIILIWRMYGCFLKKIGDKTKGTEECVFDTSLTLNQSRENFLKHLDEVSPAAAGGHAFDIANDLTYNFWIGYFVNDMLQGGNDDMTVWPYLDQVILYITIAIIAIGQAILRFGDYLFNKVNPSKAPVKKKDIHSDRVLKHQLLEEFVLEKAYDKKLKEANQNKLGFCGNRNNTIFSILGEKIEDKPNEKLGFEINFTPIFKKLDFLKEIYDMTRSKIKERVLTITTNAINISIFVSFVGWFIGATLMTAGVIAIGALILSNPVTVGLVALGAFFGATYLANYYINKDKEKEKNVDEQLKINEDKINRLKTLEHQNKKLKNLLEIESQNSIKPLTIAEPHNDRFFRRLTTQKTPILTKIKKIGNRFLLGVGNAGTGILIARLAILPLLAVTAATGPIGLGIALTLGAIWAVITVANYHREHKIAESQRLLDDIDNRISAAKKNQAIYLKQLDYRMPFHDPIPLPISATQGINNNDQSIESASNKPNLSVLPLNSKITFNFGNNLRTNEQAQVSAVAGMTPPGI